MKKKLLIILGALLALPLTCFAKFKAEDYDDKVVRIIAPVGSGTGFFINKNGYIVTNAHVIYAGSGEKYFNNICVLMQSKGSGVRLYKAQRITQSSKLDIAILRIDARTSPIKLKKDEIKRGDEVYALGYPGVNDDIASKDRFFEKLSEITIPSHPGEIKNTMKYYLELINNESNENKQKSIFNKMQQHIVDILDNIISNLPNVTPLDNTFQDYARTVEQSGNVESIKTVSNWGLNGDSTVKCIQHNVPIRHGNSGGPLINKSGLLVGVNTRGISQGEPDLLMSLDVSHLKAFLNENNISFSEGLDIDYKFILFILIICILVILLIVLIMKNHTYKPNSNIDINFPQEYDKKPSVGNKNKSYNNISNKSLKIEFSLGNRYKKKYAVSDDILNRNDYYIIVGRKKEYCDICVPDATVSSQHIGISVKGDSIYIEDRNSTNGTYINGRKLFPFTPEKVTDSDSLKIGQVLLRIYT